MAPYGGPTESLLLGMTMALRAMNPRLLLLFFLLGLVHTAHIPVRREKSVDDADERYYMHDNTRCLRCPPGTYVLKHCTNTDSLGVCEQCVHGQTYNEYLTGLMECFDCAVCRSDQEEVSPCNVTKNTVCRCKEGTYCPTNSCEMCQKCTQNCPPNQVIKAPCNSTSDTQCAPPENNHSQLYYLIPLVILILLAVLVGVMLFRCKKSEAPRWMTKILSKCDKAQEGDTEMPFLPQRSKLYLRKNLSENEKNEAIASTFHVFLDHVPPKRFEQFVRELGLTYNEIDRAKQDNTGNSYEQHHCMLMRLHQDKKFDVNICLNKLHEMKMGKVAQDITNDLLKKGWFERSTEG